MYIFGYKTTGFIQNLYILVKYFGKNFIFNAKSIFFSGPNVHFWVQNSSFYPKFVHFSEMFWQKLHFYSKEYKFFGFTISNIYFWVQNYTFYPKFVHFGEILWQKLHF